jgi:hypothetical protein
VGLNVGSGKTLAVTGTATLPAATTLGGATAVSVSGTQTLTNKTLTNPAINGFTGDTSVINIGSGQLYKDASGNVGIGVIGPSANLHVVSDVAVPAIVQSSATATTVAINNTNASGWGSNLAIRTGGADAGYFGTIGSLLGSTSQDLAIWATAGNGFRVYTNGNNERMRIDSAGNVGIGTSSPQDALDITAASGTASIRIASQGAGSLTWRLASQLVGVANAGFVIRDETNTVNRLVIDGSGNVGIGTSSPTAKLTVSGVVGNGNAVMSVDSSDFVRMYADATFGSAINWSTGDVLRFATSDSSFSGFTERARIDSSGNLLVGTTSSPVAGKIASSFLSSSSEFGAVFIDSQSNNTAIFAQFRNASTAIGSITNNNNTATAYNTSSDYRLKESIAPMTGALAKVALLKPCTYKWKINGSDGQGFIAHELAEVEPGCVTGEKDAVDAEGNPQYQGIDTSFLVATLTAAIQEQQAIINDLKTRIEALEGTQP